MTSTRDNTHLKTWMPSFQPGRGYLKEPQEWPRLPQGHKCTGLLPSLKPLDSLFVHIPKDRLPHHSRSLGAWGEGFGPRDTREAWVARDIVGQFALMRFIHLGDTLKPCLTRHDDECIGRVWMFAYISGYNSYTGEHQIVVQNRNLDTLKPEPRRSYIVRLSQCIFQLWNRPDMEGVYQTEDNETQTHAANRIYKWWKYERHQDPYDSEGSDLEPCMVCGTLTPGGYCSRRCSKWDDLEMDYY